MSESNINVAVKMRPLIKREIDKKVPACWRKIDSMLVDSSGTNEFTFDLIFDENSTTPEVYDKVARPIVSTALAGVNGTVFAYGQTSSGKTHTMMGDENNDGLMIMAIKHIFNEVQSSNIEFVLRVGFIEIYNEKVYDLYDPDNVDLKMVEKNNDAYVNCKEAICKSVEDMYNVIKIGNKNKKIGDTDMNDRSSRSHTIFRISIESIDAVSEKAKISNLNLVDLAGSERASQTGATGTRFVEGAHINKSLLSLSKVINKLINNDNCHINYRDSKLTRYLQSSLGGNALAAIICTICPTALDETISTLYFAQRAMKVTNKPRVNEIISDATMIKQLHNQIKTLKVELEKAKSGSNSAVPRIMQELSLHQGNILNYKKAENKAKLRRRTWTTFDNDLAVISETTPLVLATQQQSMTDLRENAAAAVTPHLMMVTRDRGIGEIDYDATTDFEKMTSEFDYKSKYEKLMLEYEELQEFTDWENKLGIEPDAEVEHRAQVEELRKEIGDLHKERTQLKHALSMAEQEKGSVDYQYELHQKKAGQREQDLLEMCEELKRDDLAKNALEEKNYLIEQLQDQMRELSTANEALMQKIAEYDDVELKRNDLTKNALEEKSHLIQQLQEQMRELSTANDALAQKNSEYGDVEQRVMQLEKVEVELEELKNTITILTNTVLTLENEKKEMSIRFNDSMTTSMTASTFETTQYATTSQSAPSTAVPAQETSLSSTAAVDVSKLQAEHDELSSKVMDLIEENDDLKQRADELTEKLNEMMDKGRELEERLARNAIEVEEEKKRWSDNCETQSEEVDLIRSEKEWLEKQIKLAEEKIQEREKDAILATEKLRALEQQLKESDEKLRVAEEELQSKTEAFNQLEERYTSLGSELELAHITLESRVETLTDLCEKQRLNEKHMEERISDLEAASLRHDGLEELLEKVTVERDELTEVVERLKEKITDFETDGLERKRLAECVEQITAERNELSAEIERLKERVMKSQEESLDRMALEESLQQLTAEREGLVKELAEQTLKVNELSASAETRDATLSALERTREELNALTLSRDEQLEKTVALEKQLQETSAEMDRLTVTRDGQLEKIAALEETVAELQATIEQNEGVQEKIAELEAQVEASKLQNSQLEDIQKARCELEQDVEKLAVDRDGLVKELSATCSKLADATAEKQALAHDLEKSVQESHAVAMERDCLANDLKNKLELITELEKNVEASHSDLNRDLMEAQVEKARLTTEMENKSVAFEQLRQEHDDLSRKLADQVSQLEATRSTLEHNVEQLTEQLKQKDEEIEDKMSEQSKLFVESRAAMEERIEKLLSEHKTTIKENQLLLSEQSKAFTEDKSKLEEEMAALRLAAVAKGGDLQQERDRLNADLEKQRQSVHLLTKELSTLKLTVQEMEGLVQEKEEALATLVDVRHQLTEKAQRVVELEELLESSATYERELLSVTEAKAQLQASLDVQLEKVHAVQIEKSELRGQLDGLHDSLVEKENELKRLQAELADHHTQGQAVDVELQERVVGLERQLAMGEAEIRNKDAQIHEYLEKMRELESEVDGKGNELSEAKQALEKMVARNEALEAEVAADNSKHEEAVRAIHAEKEKLHVQVAALAEEQKRAEQRFDQVGKKLRDMEEQKEELARKLKTAEGERAQLHESVEKVASKRAAAEDKCKDLQQKHEVLRNRIAALEADAGGKERQVTELTHRLQASQGKSDLHDQQVLRAHEEEVAKLQAHVKKLRGELNEFQQKKEPRKMRRSSTFDNNRHLYGLEASVETQTDPVSEMCQCEALNVKVNELKRSNMVKDLQMVELREAEKRSPALLENYALKKRLVTALEAEKSHAKEMEKMEQRLYQAVKQAKQCKVCDNKKVFSMQTQTMPDLNLEKIADLKRELSVKASSYEETKRVTLLQSERIAELERQVARWERGAENNPNQLNHQPQHQQECPTLRQKYEMVKSVVEKRYHRIIQLEKDIEALRIRRTCTVCKSRLNTLQVP